MSENSWEDLGRLIERGRIARERATAIRYGFLTPEFHEAALVDADSEIRYAAVMHGGLSDVQHQRALRDVDKLVRDGAKEMMGGWCWVGLVRDVIWHFNCFCPWR